METSNIILALQLSGIMYVLGIIVILLFYMITIDERNSYMLDVKDIVISVLAWPVIISIVVYKGIVFAIRTLFK